MEEDSVSLCVKQVPITDSILGVTGCREAPFPKELPQRLTDVFQTIGMQTMN